MELLVMAYALKTSCAKNIIGVIPYFPYSKQCKMRKRGSIVCKLLASMLAKAGKDTMCLPKATFVFIVMLSSCVEWLNVSTECQTDRKFRQNIDTAFLLYSEVDSLLICLLLQRVNTHHHHGPASEGDPGLLQFSSGQLARLTFLASVHPRRGDNPILIATYCYEVQVLESTLAHTYTTYSVNESVWHKYWNLFSFTVPDPWLQKCHHCSKVSFSRQKVNKIKTQVSPVLIFMWTL